MRSQNNKVMKSYFSFSLRQSWLNLSMKTEKGQIVTLEHAADGATHTKKLQV